MFYSLALCFEDDVCLSLCPIVCVQAGSLIVFVCSERTVCLSLSTLCALFLCVHALWFVSLCPCMVCLSFCVHAEWFVCLCVNALVCLVSLLGFFLLCPLSMLCFLCFRQGGWFVFVSIHFGGRGSPCVIVVSLFMHFM